MDNIAKLLILLIVGAVAGLGFIAYHAKPANLDVEVAKALLQLSVVAIAGHVVSVLISKANHERDDLMRANELRNALLDRLNKAYAAVKKVRRLARASCRKVDAGAAAALFLDETKYNDFMQQLIAADLELELVSIDIHSNGSLFVDLRALSPKLDAMETYLNHLIREYEQLSLPTVSSPAHCYEVAKLPRLSELLSASKPSAFHLDFVANYHATLESIRKASVRAAIGA